MTDSDSPEWRDGFYWIPHLPTLIFPSFVVADCARSILYASFFLLTCTFLVLEAFSVPKRNIEDISITQYLSDDDCVENAEQICKLTSHLDFSLSLVFFSLYFFSWASISRFCTLLVALHFKSFSTHGQSSSKHTSYLLRVLVSVSRVGDHFFHRF